MSDNIPFDIQREILKKVSDVKSLIRFRSVSKPWKSFIDSYEFINVYGARNTQPHSCILRYRVDYSSYSKSIYLVDDDIETFMIKQQKRAPFVVSPLVKQVSIYMDVGVCHGLLCLFGLDKGYSNNWMIVVWNLSIGKSFGIALPTYNPRIRSVFGFGVCPVIRDPTIVTIWCPDNMPWHVEVFTLSSGVCNVIPSANLPRQSIRLNSLTHAVIDRFIYWGASEETFTDNGESATNHMLVSFDLITKEFKVVDLPHCLTNELRGPPFVSKLRESLVVYGTTNVEGIDCHVWVMEHDSCFRKLFTIGAMLYRILGFRKNGKPMLEILNADKVYTTLNVYDPHSQQIKYLGISGIPGLFFMCSYKESLLLFDHFDSHIYNDNN